MELILSGLGIIFLMGFWKFVWKPTIVDMHRDAWFDLRQKLRDDFVANGWDLNSLAYKRMRDLANGYLRYTEDFSLSEFRYIEKRIRENIELQNALKARFEKRFTEGTKEQQSYIIDFRNTSRKIMMSYMILSSTHLSILTVTLAPFIALYVIVNYVIKGIRSGSLVFMRRLGKATDLCFVFFSIVVLKVARMVLIEDIVEEYSYRQAAA